MIRGYVKVKRYLRVLHITGAVVLGLLFGPEQAAAQYTRYFSWQQDYSGTIWAWMSPDVYQQFAQRGIGDRQGGPQTVTAGQNVYRGAYFGQGTYGAGQLYVVKLQLTTQQIQPPQQQQQQQATGCPPESLWNVVVQGNAYSYHFKVKLNRDGTATVLYASGDRMYHIQAQGRAQGQQFSLDSVDIYTKTQASIQATLSADCSKGSGYQRAGRTPGGPDLSGPVTIARVG